ncbi:two-component response regulator ORR6 [Brachypodium distachyon]|uniref:Response regulatory domain-containing protein n=1 Tax=Brachypodium distachyon TaxID=15368 RepID=A0A0Q3GW57_BRADI|nr:two-component response regulator ORR6 [Brachypodium distachyon]KQJ85250.1 hypothetical protein BRADI_5g25860v3 [Brachypodium distachyon]|eukprot:XP_003579464.2 two-component response regulator ORR6 [Brachypodium distachyon]
MAAAAPALSLAPMATTVTAAAAQKAASPKAAAGGDVRKVVPVMAAAADEVVVQELHVLAVDDSVVDRAVIAKILRSSKYRVTTVESATRALELLGLGLITNVNMIITDYWMPGMTGYELLKRVKESSELKEIPVVIMSSENVPNRINRCLEEGAEDFLLKPVRPSDVSRLCSRIR